MKKTNFLCGLAVLLLVLNIKHANAKVWRVNKLSNYNATSLWGNNLGGTATLPVFKELSDVMSSNLVSSTAGDTIHLEGSSVNYNNPTITKRLIIIGPGYFLNDNASSSYNLLTATLSGTSVFFNAGSEGTQLIGIHIDAGLAINVSNILIKRCLIADRIGLVKNTSNIRFLQNFFLPDPSLNNTNSLIYYGNTGYASDVIFNNNICRKPIILDDGDALLECSNNVFDIPVISNNIILKINAGSFRNNILKNTSISAQINYGNTSNVSHNISAASNNQFGTFNSNIIVSDMTTLFVDAATNTTDGDYQLRSNSPGSNNGSDGSDRGAFGGAAISNRYTLSGLALIPVIYSISTPGVSGTTGLSVTIKARIIN